MSSRRYAGDSAVREAVFHRAKNRRPVALLFAAPEAAPEKLSALRPALDSAGRQTVPVHAEGRPALQVSGFAEDSEIEDTLRAQGLIQGEATIIPDTAEKEKPLSHADRIRQMSLKLAGMFNLVGNTGMVVDGVKKRDPFRMAGGALLTLGAANLVRYGNAKPEYYERLVAEDLAGFLRDQGVEPLPESRLAAIVQHKKTGATADAERFLYQNPAQVTLGVDAVGSSALLTSGVRKMHKEGWGGVGFGIGSLGLKLVSLALPEKTQEESKPEQEKSQNPISRAVNWMKEKPLRMYGMGSLVTDALLGVDAYQQYKTYPGQRKYVFTAVSGTCYTLADIMYMMSSKNHVNDDGKFTADEQRAIEAMAAESIAVKPESERRAIADRLGKFLEARREVKGSAESISRSIIEQAERLNDNPWTERVNREAPSAHARQT